MNERIYTNGVHVDNTLVSSKYSFKKNVLNFELNTLNQIKQDFQKYEIYVIETKHNQIWKRVNNFIAKNIFVEAIDDDKRIATKIAPII